MIQCFIYEQISFDYHLTLEERKTISLTVFPNQSIVVKAPLHATNKKITDFLRKKFRWVLKQQRYFANFKPAAQKEYISGETFRYLGRNYKLLVSDEKEKDHVSLQHGTLTVFSFFPKNRLYTRKLLYTWYLEKAQKHFSERLELCIEEYDINNKPALIIKQMKSRWGSYSRKTNRICLNLKLIEASKHQIDYVITHELCHIDHLAHNNAFYRLLNKRQPNWKSIKTELERSLLSTL